MMNRSPEYIETLLREKEFSQLTEAERELVLTHLSGESEYRNMRRLVSRVRETFQTEAAQLTEDAEMRERVMLRFSQNLPKSEPDQGIIYACLTLFKRKPALAFAGTLTLMIFLVTASVFFWPDTKSELAEKNNAPDQTDIPVAPAESTDITAADTDTEAEITTKEKTGKSPEIAIVPKSPKIDDKEYSTDTDEALTEDMPNERTAAMPAAVREEITISKAEADEEKESPPTETATLKKESKKNTGKVREDRMMMNQASGTGKVFTAIPELQDASAGQGSIDLTAKNEADSKEAVQRQITGFLWQKAREEGKTDFLNAHRGKTVLLTITFQTDGKVTECMISGAADTLSQKWMKAKMADMPGLNPPKDVQQAKYQIRF